MLEVESGISAEVIEARGYRTASSSDELIALGFSRAQAAQVPALLVPIWGPSGFEPVSYQLRPDNPRLNKDGKPIKYESLPKGGPRLDVPREVREKLANPRVRLWLTEGCRKADSAVSRGLDCLSLSGVWNFKARTEQGGSALLGDFGQVHWKGREVVICFDSDVMTNPSVNLAITRLMDLFASLGAIVKCALLADEGAGKVGLDDFLVAGGTLEELEARIVSSAPSAPKEAKEERKSKAKLAIELGSKFEFFNDGEGGCFATIRRNGHVESYSLEDSAFKTLLCKFFYETYSDALGESASDALEVFKAKALFDGLSQGTFIRVGHQNGKIYIDLGDPDWAVVEISEQGWQLLRESPLRFIRPSGLRPLPKPIRGEEIDRLTKYINAEAEDDLSLILAFVVGAYMNPREASFPHLVLVGEKGSSKSTLAKVLHRIIDPRKVELRSANGGEDLLLAASKVRVLVLDNLRQLKPWLSDDLCKLSTGDGISKRKLYTDAEEVSINAKVPVILTGIEQIVTASDLADRSLMPRLKRINPDTRMEEREFWNQFEADWPYILGALYDVLSLGLASVKSVRKGSLFRMADFHRWALACEAGFGNIGGRFDSAFEASNKAGSEASVEESTLARLLLAGARQGRLADFQESPTVLLDLLKEVASDDERKELPKVNQLRGELRKVAPSLRDLGIHIEADPPRHAKVRVIRVQTDVQLKTVTGVTGVTPGSRTLTSCDARSSGCDGAMTTEQTWLGLGQIQGDDGDDNDAGSKRRVITFGNIG